MATVVKQRANPSESDDKYSHLSKEQAIGLLRRRDAERQYGLVWERDEFEHERSLNDDFVVLDLDNTLSTGLPPYQNVLIEGDNFDALRYLRIAYKSRVKCIYIDPPFNLGRRDFIYNDRYVDEDDAYKHSKWLEFMFRRLTLARDLLSEDGVIFVSIGEVEYANLSLLMDKIFPKMKVCTFVWRRRSGANDSKDRFVSVDHEYVLCYGNRGFSFAGMSKEANYSNPDKDPRGPWIDGPLNQGKDLKQRSDAYYPLYNPKTDTWYACDPDSVWRFASEERIKPGQKLRSKTMEQLIREGRVKFPIEEEPAFYHTTEQLEESLRAGKAPHNLRIYENLEQVYESIDRGEAPDRLRDFIYPIDFWVGKRIGYMKPRLKRIASEIKRTEKPVSTWIVPSAIKAQDLECIDLDSVTYFQVGSTSEGTTLLARMIGNKDFQYPKPLSLIKALIGQVTDADSADIVMDFFAGSGTTGHAVLSLNSEDNGNRSFILVSATEATTQNPTKNACRDVAQKRLRAAIDGYSYRTSRKTISVEGLAGEFAYMRANRIPRETLAIDIRHDQVWFTLQQMHSNVVSPFVREAAIQVLDGDEGTDLVYVPKLDKLSLDALLERILKLKRPTVVYTWQPALVSQRLSEEYVVVRKIPDYIVERFGGAS
jgi:adenine-specific DNA-methyltransferase